MRILLSILLALPLSLAAKAPLAPGDNAVAWAASKRMMFSHSDPVGVNKAATAELSATATAAYVVKVLIPIDKFDSGTPSRDKEVVKALGGEAQPVMVFESTTLTAKDLAALRATGGILAGTLTLNNKAHPIQFTVTADGKTVAGEAQLKMSALEVKAPSFVGGLVMKVADEVGLYFQYDVAAIKGQDAIK